LPGSGRRSAICSQSAVCRVSWVSKDMASLQRKTVHRDGTYGSSSRSRPRHPQHRHRRSRWLTS